MKDNYITPKVGLDKFKNEEDVPVEIMSPFRKKKGTLQKLKVDSDSEEQDETRFKDLLPALEKVTAQLKEKKSDFELLKAKTPEQLRTLDLQKIARDWQANLELRLPETVDEKVKLDFAAENKTELKEVE